MQVARTQPEASRLEVACPQRANAQVSATEHVLFGAPASHFDQSAAPPMLIPPPPLPLVGAPLPPLPAVAGSPAGLAPPVLVPPPARLAARDRAKEGQVIATDKSAAHFLTGHPCRPSGDREGWTCG